MMPEADDLLLLLCTCADDAEAEKIARLLVTQNLAACVQLAPIRSIYRWQGQVQSCAEVRLAIKTCASHRLRVEAAIRAAHSYQVPQIVALPISYASSDYADWVRANLDAG